MLRGSLLVRDFNMCTAERLLHRANTCLCLHWEPHSPYASTIERTIVHMPALLKGIPWLQWSDPSNGFPEGTVPIDQVSQHVPHPREPRRYYLEFPPGAVHIYRTIPCLSHHAKSDLKPESKESSDLDVSPCMTGQSLTLGKFSWWVLLCTHVTASQPVMVHHDILFLQVHRLTHMPAKCSSSHIFSSGNLFPQQLYLGEFPRMQHCRWTRVLNAFSSTPR